MKTAIASVLVALTALSCSPANVGGPLVDAGADAAPTPDTGTDASTNVTQACLDRAYAYCTQLETCSTTAIEYRFGNVQTCKKLIAGVCELANGAASTGATVAGTEACAAAESSWVCSDIIYTQNVPPACASVPGELASGAACTVNAQCQAMWCSRPAGQSCGVCAPPPKAGDPCDNGACLAPLTCSSTTSTCVAYVEVGGQCGNGSSPCDSGLSCVAGICQAGATMVNAPCVPAGPGCDQFAGLSCNVQTQTCKTLALIPPGGACGVVADQPTLCAVGACIRGTCVPYGTTGEACEIASGLGCAENLHCIASSDSGTAGTCQLIGSGTCP